MKSSGQISVKSARSAGKIGLGLLFGVGLWTTARAETLTLATYNIENYVAADRMTEAGYRRDYPKPEAEMVRGRVAFWTGVHVAA